ncbi:unnamed protein product [Ixodes persulcatus]
MAAIWLNITWRLFARLESQTHNRTFYHCKRFVARDRLRTLTLCKMSHCMSSFNACRISYIYIYMSSRHTVLGVLSSRDPFFVILVS